MKKLLLLLCLVIGMYACSKDKITNEIPTNIPAWLQTKIAEIKADPANKLMTVEEYSWNAKTYYNIRAVHQSCMLCEVYDAAGARVNSADIPTTTTFNGVIWMYR